MKANLQNRHKEKVFLSIIMAYPLLIFLIFYVAVNFNSILLAFQHIDADYNYSFSGISNFVSVIDSLKNDLIVLTSLKNSVLIFTITTAIGFPLNILFSFYLYKKCFAHKSIRFIVMLPAIVSGMVMSLIFQRFVETALPGIMHQISGAPFPNLLSNRDTVFTTVIFFMLWTGFSSSLILYPNAMNAIDPEINESAKLDGCSNIKELWHIVLPMIFPTITTFFVAGVSGLFMISGPLVAFWYHDAPVETYTTGYYLFTIVLRPGSTIHSYPFASAMGIVFTFATLPITLFVKYIMEKFDPTRDI